MIIRAILITSFLLYEDTASATILVALSESISYAYYGYQCVRLGCPRTLFAQFDSRIQILAFGILPTLLERMAYAADQIPLRLCFEGNLRIMATVIRHLSGSGPT